MSIHITIEPEGEEREERGLRSVQGLLNRLGVRQTEVLVIRDGGLLTQDVPLADGDRITIRTVVSRG